MNTNSKKIKTDQSIIHDVSCLFKLRRYASGFIIGICIEYFYRVDTPYWYFPLGIAILQISLMIFDCLLNKR